MSRVGSESMVAFGIDDHRRQGSQCRRIWSVRNQAPVWLPRRSSMIFNRRLDRYPDPCVSNLHERSPRKGPDAQTTWKCDDHPKISSTAIFQPGTAGSASATCPAPYTVIGWPGSRLITGKWSWRRGSGHSRRRLYRTQRESARLASDAPTSVDSGSRTQSHSSAADLDGEGGGEASM